MNAEDPQIVQDTVNQYQNRIKNLEDMYKTAPDKIVRKEAEYVYKPASYYMHSADKSDFMDTIDAIKEQDEDMAQKELDFLEKQQAIFLDADLDGGFYGEIMAKNLESDSEIWNVFSFWKSNRPMNEPYILNERQEVKISKQEAVQLANDTLKELGLTNMILLLNEGYSGYLEGENGKITGYNFTFVPEYQRIPLVGVEALPEEDYRPSYDLEYISVVIDDSGITSLMWQYPQKTNIVNDNVALLNFDQIMERAKTQIELEYNAVKLLWYAPENPDYEEYVASIKSASLTIDEISLVMLKIPVKDNLQEYYIIPAWIFKGSDSLEFKDMDHAGFGGWYGHKTYTAINAVDGSTISISPVNGIM